MRWVAIAGLLALCACTSRVERAEKQYDMVKRANAGAAEICTKGHAVAEAYLEAGNDQDYQLHKAMMDGDCLSASLDEKNGIYHDAGGNLIVADSLDINGSDAPAPAEPSAPNAGNEAPQDDPTNPCYKAGPRC